MSKLLKKSRLFNNQKLLTILTNGQASVFSSLVQVYNTRTRCHLSNDFLSNQLWKSIDAPKVVVSLIRFDRKYLRGSI